MLASSVVYLYCFARETRIASSASRILRNLRMEGERRTMAVSRVRVPQDSSSERTPATMAEIAAGEKV